MIGGFPAPGPSATPVPASTPGAAGEVRLPIAKIPVAPGVCLWRIAAGDLAYEWFYVEIFAAGQHAVLIFSLSDPFRSATGAAPPSLYVSWNRGNALVDYAYSLFEGEAADAFRSAVADFFERKSLRLELSVPSHGLGHDVAVWLEWASPGTVTDEGHVAAFESYVSAARRSGTEHYWQPLALGPALRGRLFRSYAGAGAAFAAGAASAHSVADASGVADAHGVADARLGRDSTSRPGAGGRSRASGFFDVPRARLLSRAARRAGAELAFDAGDPDAWCYVDHNGGFEPLSRVREPWFWWHARAGDHAEIGYWFPGPARGYRCGAANLTAIDGFGERDPVVEPAITAFGVRAARAIRMADGRVARFSRVVEAAPFYARLLADDPAASPGTVEALAPSRLDLPFCRGLMAARQTRVARLGAAWGSRDFLDTCRKVTAAHGRSFHLASHVLPAASRDGAYFVYTLCRLIDDATDEAGGAGALGSADFLDAIYAPARGSPAARDSSPPPTPPPTSSDTSSATPCTPAGFVARALAACGAWECADPVRARSFLCEARLAAADLGLERGLFEELVEGQRMDESHEQPRDFALCYVYCFRVAGVVGLLMARILGVGARAPEGTVRAAEHLGIAMQLTNILRDVKEDWEGRGRVYLPADACAAAGVAFPDVLRAPSAAAEELVLSVGSRAVGYYESAMRGVAGIPTWRGRMCVRLMTAVYGAILGALLVAPRRSFEGRVVIPVRRRLLLAAQVLLGRDPLRVAGLHTTNRVRSDPACR